MIGAVPAALPWPDVSTAGPWTSQTLGWVDADYGPVRALSGTRMAPPDPSWWVFGSELARSPLGTWFGGTAGTAAGTSVDAREALLRCLGETVERYSALSAPVEPVDAVHAPLDPYLAARLPRCAVDEQCPPQWRDRPPSVPVTQVPMMRLADGERVDVPAGFVHLSFRAPAGEPWLTMPVSTGLAFDPSPTAALWRGLCECIERDAMMRTWFERRPAAEIDTSGAVPPGIAERVSRLAAVDLHARLFDIGIEPVGRSVFCVLTGDRFPHLVVGASCRESLAAACEKALDEAVSMRLAVAGSAGFVPPDLTDFGWLDELEQHAQLYAGGHLRHAFDFLLANRTAPIAFADAEVAGRRVPPGPPDAIGLRNLAAELERDGLTVLWADVSAPELGEHGRVVKVFVPELVPLSQLHHARWLASRRLGASAASVNPFPHPFA